MEVTKLPKDLQELVLEFHEAGPAHRNMNIEFLQLVAGRPWTCWSMLWVDWWGAEYQLHAPPDRHPLRRFLHPLERFLPRDPLGDPISRRPY